LQDITLASRVCDVKTKQKHPASPQQSCWLRLGVFFSHKIFFYLAFRLKVSTHVNISAPAGPLCQPFSVLARGCIRLCGPCVLNNFFLLLLTRRDDRCPRDIARAIDARRNDGQRKCRLHASKAVAARKIPW